MSEQPFPPADPAAFLALCDGQWMSLRSCFELSMEGDDEWHSSERGELTVRCEATQPSGLGQLVVQPPSGDTSTLSFAEDGGLSRNGEPAGNTLTIHCRGAAQTQIHAREPNALLHQNTIGFREVEFHAAVGPKAPGPRRLTITR